MGSIKKHWEVGELHLEVSVSIRGSEIASANIQCDAALIDALDTNSLYTHTFASMPKVGEKKDFDKFVETKNCNHISDILGITTKLDLKRPDGVICRLQVGLENVFCLDYNDYIHIRHDSDPSFSDYYRGLARSIGLGDGNIMSFQKCDKSYAAKDELYGGDNYDDNEVHIYCVPNLTSEGCEVVLSSVEIFTVLSSVKYFEDRLGKVSFHNLLEVATGEPVYCANMMCRAEVPADGRFCHKCGRAINDDNTKRVKVDADANY